MSFRDDVTKFEREYQTAGFAFVKGAKYASQPVQRLGEIIQQYAPNLPRNVVNELREIFELNKEIVDEQ